MGHRGAAREIGISGTTANNWSRGYKVYRRGQLVGFVPPLERLAVRQISPRFLSQDERIELADLRYVGLSIRQIACRLGRAPSTISRELRRNATDRCYRPFDAHRHATARRARYHWRRLEAVPALGLMVAELCRSDGVRSRSAATCAEAFPSNRACGCVPRASIRPSTSRDQRCCVRHRWLHTDDPRCGRAETTAAPSSVSNDAGPGSSSRCSPSMTVGSHRGPIRTRPLGGGFDHRQGPGSAIGTLVERRTRLVAFFTFPTATARPSTTP